MKPVLPVPTPPYGEWPDMTVMSPGRERNTNRSGQTDTWFGVRGWVLVNLLSINAGILRIELILVHLFTAKSKTKSV